MLSKDMEGVNNLITALRNRHMGLDGQHLPRIRDALNILLYHKLDRFQLDMDDMWEWVYDDIADLIENVRDGKPLVNPVPSVWYFTTKLHYFEGSSHWSICGRAVAPPEFRRRGKGIPNDRLNEPWISERCKYCTTRLEKILQSKK